MASTHPCQVDGEAGLLITQLDVPSTVRVHWTNGKATFATERDTSLFLSWRCSTDSELVSESDVQGFSEIWQEDTASTLHCLTTALKGDETCRDKPILLKVSKASSKDIKVLLTQILRYSYSKESRSDRCDAPGEDVLLCASFM